MRQDIKIILQSLTDKDPSDSIAEEKTIKLLDGLQNSYTLIDDLRTEIQRIKDFRGDREPFYNLYLSIAYLNHKDFKSAKDVLENAVQGFQIQGLSLNEAMGEWLFSIIHFENKNNERAQRACEVATTTLQQLTTQCEEEGKYEKAKEYRNYLLHLENLREDIEISQSAEDGETPEDTSAYSYKSSNHQEVKAVKSKLRYYYDELNKTFEYLRGQKTKIPPTLVAAIFYIYKTLAPSHSVYRSVPSPETDEEKRIYKELIEKIGFFEVIEQLVDIERDFEPTASREEILEKINEEWDKDVNR